MRRRLQFSLSGLAGVTAIFAVVSLLLARCGRDPSHAGAYKTTAIAILACSACVLPCPVPRGAGVLFFCLLTMFGVFEFFAMSVVNASSRNLHVSITLAILLSSVVLSIMKGLRRQS